MTTVKEGDVVVWLGRKTGSCSYDNHFIPWHIYTVYFIYPSNGDVELQGDQPHITTRAGDGEWFLIEDANTFAGRG